MNRKELENRLIDFAINIVKTVEKMPNTRIGRHFSGQLLRSGTSPALNYAESQSAESRKDFVHKMSIALKELRETLICLTIMKGAGVMSSWERLDFLQDECNQLVSIFVKSIDTTKKNNFRKP